VREYSDVSELYRISLPNKCKMILNA